MFCGTLLWWLLPFEPMPKIYRGCRNFTFYAAVAKNKLNSKATISNEWSLNKKIIPLYSTQLYK